MPVEHRPDFYFHAQEESKKSLSALIEDLIETCSCTDTNQDAAEIAAENLTIVCERVVQRTLEWQAQHTDPHKEGPWEANLLKQVMRAGLLLSNDQMCLAALGLIRIELPQPETVKLIERVGFHKMKEL